ncbi:peroxidase [Candidatus Acetothermia bacterium]|nr:MAG: peroxidase [Candidatus Acetothermia bacterium]
MAWIRIIDESEAEGRLKEVYGRLKAGRGKVSNIMAVHSLHPEAMDAHLDLYMAIMFGESGLTRPEREMIAVVVSAVNRCSYCINHHAAALDHYWKDGERLSRFTSDFRSVELPPRIRAVLEYAEKLTRAPDEVSEEDIAPLREEGLSDSEILSVNLIASYFNFVNRIAIGLGVGSTPDEVSGYEY